MAIEYAPGQKTISAKGRIATIVLFGILALLLAGAAGYWAFAPLMAWDTAALLFMVWMWVTIWPMNGETTGRFAVREDPSRTASDFILLIASVASLVSVGHVLIRAGHSQGAAQIAQIAFSAISVVLSWALVHTLFTLHYARLYYTKPIGGIDFQDQAQPTYSDFAYLAFTLGMTFQVSDTTLKSNRVRRMAFKHAMLSYLFGTIIVATTINLVAGLIK